MNHKKWPIYVDLVPEKWHFCDFVRKPGFRKKCRKSRFCKNRIFGEKPNFDFAYFRRTKSIFWFHFFHFLTFLRFSRFWPFFAFLVIFRPFCRFLTFLRFRCQGSDFVRVRGFATFRTSGWHRRPDFAILVTFLAFRPIFGPIWAIFSATRVCDRMCPNKQEGYR